MNRDEGDEGDASDPLHPLHPCSFSFFIFPVHFPVPFRLPDLYNLAISRSLLAMMNRWLQVALITAGCAAVYAGLRLLPVEQCAFLHYGEFVNSEGVIEGCGYEETGFFDMRQIRYPIVTTLTPLEEPRVGAPVTLKLTLFTTTGKPVRWQDIAVSHTERVHALVVDPSLQDYQHVHPRPAGPDGHYLLEVAPRAAGEYAVYLDFISLVTSRRTLLECRFTVPGEPAAPVAAQRLRGSFAGLELAFVPEQAELRSGRELVFRLEVADPAGGPVRFTPVMDSYAHVVAFDAARTGFAHLHPMNPLISGQDPSNPDLRFAMRFDAPGHYRVWAQFIANGREVFAPFDLDLL